MKNEAGGQVIGLIHIGLAKKSDGTYTIELLPVQLCDADLQLQKESVSANLDDKSDRIKELVSECLASHGSGNLASIGADLADRLADEYPQFHMIDYDNLEITEVNSEETITVNAEDIQFSPGKHNPKHPLLGQLTVGKRLKGFYHKVLAQQIRSAGDAPGYRVNDTKLSDYILDGKKSDKFLDSFVLKHKAFRTEMKKEYKGTEKDISKMKHHDLRGAMNLEWQDFFGHFFAKYLYPLQGG